MPRPWLYFAAVAIGCAGPPTGPAQDVVIAQSAGSTRTTAVADPPIDAELIRLDELACTWSSGIVFTEGDAPISLCDAEGRRCFLKAIDVPFQWRLVSLDMSQGRNPRFLLRLGYGGMTIRGFVSPASVFLFPQRPAVAARGWIPHRVRAVEGAAHSFVAAMDSTGFTPDAPLVETFACDQVAPHSSWWEPEEELELMGASGSGTSSQLEPRGVPLFDRSGTRLGIIESTEPLLIRAFQLQHRRRLVRIQRATGTMFGWVDPRAISPAPPARGTMAGSFPSNESSWTVGPDDSPGLRCPRPLRLFARVGADGAAPSLLEIGVVEDGALLTVRGAPNHGLIEVVLRHDIATSGGSPPEKKPHEKLALTEGTKLVIAAADVSDCVSTDPRGR